MRHSNERIEGKWAATDDGPSGGNGEDRPPGPEPTSGQETEGEAEPAAAEEAPDPLSLANAERDRCREQMLRIAADFDNFRKRTRRDLDEAKRQGRDEMLRDLLPVLDNLERAVEHAATAGAPETVTKGLDMVVRLLADTLERSGVRAIAETGVPFDPTIHDAFQQEATDSHPPGTVVRVVQKGYLAGSRLVRPAMVVVAAAPPSRKEPEDGGTPPTGNA